MKKILLFSLIGCLSFIGFVEARTCGPVTVSFEGNQDPDDNEFLYRDKNEFDLTKNGYENSGHKNSGAGHAYECDEAHSGSCTTDEEITLAAGHVFKGKVINSKKTYRCNAGFEDWWEEVASQKCTTRWGDLSVGKMLQETKTTEECSGITLTEPDTKAVESWYVVCREGGTVVCKPAKCNKGYTPKGDKCVKDCPNCVDPDPDPTPNPTPNENGCEENDGTIVPVGKYSNYNSCPWDLDRDGAALCSCQCIRLDNGGLRWKCDVNKCKGDSESVYHYNKNKTNVTGGKGVCEEKKGNYCDKYKKYAKRYACCIAGKATKWNGNDMSDDGTCECVDKNKVWDGKKCVAKPQNDCESQYPGNPEAIACCKIGKSWFLPGHTCQCGDGYEWKYDSNTQTGECIAKVKPDDTPKPCTPSGCEIKVEQGVRCPNGNYLSETQIFEVCKEDLGTIGCDKFQMEVNDCRSTDCVKKLLARLESYDAIIERVCRNGSSPVNVPGRDSEDDVVKAKKTLDDFYAYAKGNRSVWKDSEGKFNTTRLASDLTAGVVLGTVGGVVSGVVIKKKQVEKGFDALHCTVGGQTVADWGDTFNVGLR